jgi:photosystem II stability/assembly factor-like uncharacterized protein
MTMILRLRKLKATLDRCTLFTLLALVIAAHCTASTAVAANSWTKKRVSSFAWLHSVFFLDRHRGWAVGSRGTVLTTNDGGLSWKAKSAPTDDTIRDIYFSDELNGILVCERSIFDLKTNQEPRAYLMKTMDGGEHWKRVNMRGGIVDTRLTRAVFTRTGRGWAFGEGGALYSTQDEGLSWLKLQAPTRFLLLGGTFIDESSGWLVGAGSTILQTTDGGETWNHSRLPGATNVRLNSISFVDARLGWAVGNRGAIYRTVNGGRSWKLQYSGASADLFDVKFLNATEGWVVGDEGTVLHTIDGGLRWTSERSGTTHKLERIFFADRNHGWAVGFGGTIIVYGRAEAPRLR